MSCDEKPLGTGPAWRFLQASHSVLVLRVNPSGTILAANDYAKKLIGEALLGQPWDSILLSFGGKPDLAEWQARQQPVRLLNIHTAEGLPQTLEVRIEAIDADYLLFGEVNGSDQALLSRQVLELNHELNNISRELALKNDDLIKTQSQLLQSEKMAAIGQLAAGMAHEINNPIGIVKSNLGAFQRHIADINRVLQTYLALEHELGVASQERVKHLKNDVELDYLQQDLDMLIVETFDGVQRVQDIVRDLKTFSHLHGQEQAWANLENCLDSTLSLLGRNLTDKADVIKDYAGLPEILCAPSQLNQVFMNILLNARQAIEGHGQITIRTGLSASEVRVDIEDTGQGIAPEHLGRIFEPFFTTRPVGQGTGLGLSLSYGIVKRHHGRIEVSSEPGKGTRFTLALPRN